jgi:hypothetical protein
MRDLLETFRPSFPIFRCTAFLAQEIFETFVSFEVIASLATLF